MNILVCIKQIPDPEAPRGSIKIDSTSNKAVISPNVPSVVSIFDEYAVEAALRIKEAQGGKITILSLGNNLQRDVVKKPISMGADELILLEDQAFEGGDSWSTAYTLSQAIKKINSYDLILCGRQSADWDSGQVGIGIAQFLNLPSITIARKIEIVNDKAIVERVTESGVEVVEVSLPALVTLSNEHDAPRYPAIKGVIAAKKIQPIIWKPSDIDVNPQEIGAQGRHIMLVKLYQPIHENQCEYIKGESSEEAAGNLALKLKEAKLL